MTKIFEIINKFSRKKTFSPLNFLRDQLFLINNFSIITRFVNNLRDLLPLYNLTQIGRRMSWSPAGQLPAGAQHNTSSLMVECDPEADDHLASNSGRTGTRKTTEAHSKSNRSRLARHSCPLNKIGGICSEVDEVCGEKCDASGTEFNESNDLSGELRRMKRYKESRRMSQRRYTE